MIGKSEEEMLRSFLFAIMMHDFVGVAWTTGKDKKRCMCILLSSTNRYFKAFSGATDRNDRRNQAEVIE
jgi:hypothetical protein